MQISSLATLKMSTAHAVPGGQKKKSWIKNDILDCCNRNGALMMEIATRKQLPKYKESDCDIKKGERQLGTYISFWFSTESELDLALKCLWRANQSKTESPNPTPSSPSFRLTCFCERIMYKSYFWSRRDRFVLPMELLKPKYGHR